MAASAELDGEVLGALGAIASLFAELGPLAEVVERRADEIAGARADGRSWREVVTAERRPLVVERVSQVLAELAAASAQLRRAEARALHEDGATMEEIAALFGVSRQRVSALLRGG